MKSLGGLLRRGRPGERGEFSATFVVGAMNDALQAVLQLSSDDARATSFRQGIVTIGASHGAVAGLIQQSVAELLRAANEKIRASGGGPETITKILTRPQASPSL